MSKLSEKKVIALTGCIGSGKSTVGQLLAKHIPCLDVDKVNASLLKPEILQDLYLPKQEMTQRLFSDPDYKQAVQACLHPRIKQIVLEWIDQQTTSCVVEVPLLFEVGWQDEFDMVWCVLTSPERALDRLVGCRHLTREDALARMANQWDPQDKASRSDVVIMNDGSFEQLEQEVERKYYDHIFNPCQQGTTK